MNELQDISGNNIQPIIPGQVNFLDPNLRAYLTEIGQEMANSGEMVPDHLRNEPEKCKAIARKALQWGNMDPYAVAQHSFVEKGKVAYEAKLVAAVLHASGLLATRLKYEFVGDWDAISGKHKYETRTGKGGKTYKVRKPGWEPSEEQGLGIVISAVLKGESEPTVRTVWLKEVAIRNSTNWSEDPRQQMIYVGTQRWARAFCSEAVMGIHVKEELAEYDRMEKEINPAPASASSAIHSRFGNKANVESEPSPAPLTVEAAPPVDVAALLEQYKIRIEGCDSQDELKDVGRDLAADNQLGEDNKKVLRQYYTDHQAVILKANQANEKVLNPAPDTAAMAKDYFQDAGETSAPQD